MDNPPNGNKDGRPISTTPSDFIQILKETINFYEQCKTQDMAELLLDACSDTIEYYQDGLIKTMVYQNIVLND